MSNVLIGMPIDRGEKVEKTKNQSIFVALQKVNRKTTKRWFVANSKWQMSPKYIELESDDFRDFSKDAIKLQCKMKSAYIFIFDGISAANRHDNFNIENAEQRRRKKLY